MKRLLTLLAILSCFFVFTGCPYESDVSIDTPSLYVNNRLLGTWEARNNKDEVFKVTKKDEFTYSIEKSNRNNKEKETEKFFAFGSSVGGVTFLNINEDKSD